MDGAPERGFATRAIHGQELPPVEQDAPSVPIFQTTTFRFDTSEAFAETINFRRHGYTYTRGYGNPTLLAFERVMAELEGTESAISFASGMAAIHTVATTLAASGDTIAASAELYGGTYALFDTVLPRYGIEVRFVSPHDHDAVRSALEDAVFLYVETIANPNVTVADLEVLGRIASEAGVPSVVDNTFASPYLCNPSAYGFDYLLHSATKYIGGHMDLIGGIVCTTEERMAGLRSTVIETGGTMAPLEAWLSMRGLMTLEVRMERHSRTALELTSWLEGHPKVERVHYPGLPSHPQHAVARRELTRGFGGMAAFEVVGGVEAGQRFCDALELVWVAASLGGIQTLVCHPASTTHRQLDPAAREAAGIADGLIRLSVGLEDLDDLKADIERALEKV
jgi:cystathionine beta-lyase/cystathionine gamma-synthase